MIVRGRRYGSSFGFTLIELLVAMGIFAVVALMAYGGLNQIINARLRSEDSLERLTRIQFAIRQMAMDMEQLNPRPVREELSETLVPAVLADLRRFYQLEFTRGGWRNPLGNPRSTLQRVGYRLDDGEIIRSHWLVLDRLQISEPVETTLLENVDTFRLRFLNGDDEWIESWPDPDDQTGQMVDARPRAVEVTLEFRDDSQAMIRRVFEVMR